MQIHRDVFLKLPTSSGKTLIKNVLRMLKYGRGDRKISMLERAKLLIHGILIIASVIAAYVI